MHENNVEMYDGTREENPITNYPPHCPFKYEPDAVKKYSH